MASLNLGQDVANKRERKQTAAHIVAKPYSLQPVAGICHYGSLININPSGLEKGKCYLDYDEVPITCIYLSRTENTVKQRSFDNSSVQHCTTVLSRTLCFKKLTREVVLKLSKHFLHPSCLPPTRICFSDNLYLL